MATMPVVWCTDPNSVNNKPTAFALHGIQLQGNVTEKQVLALRELVNAAAEGRLILPSDGTFMLLDSGISIESSIVNNDNSGGTICPVTTATSIVSPSTTTATSSTAMAATLSNGSCGVGNLSNKENIDQNRERNRSNDQRHLKNTYILMPVTTTAQKNVTVNLPTTITTPPTSIATTPTFELEEPPNFELEPKYSTFTPPPSTTEDDDVLYEFLCCAKCMNDPTTSRCSRKTKMSTTISQHRKSQSQQMLQRLLKSCERSSSLRQCSGGGSGGGGESSCCNNGKVNEPHQLYDPTNNIANKYTRRYQRKHCNMSAATIARNRHHNHRHKLPMQSVKIFHNRNHACSNGGGGNSAGNCGGGAGSGGNGSSGVLTKSTTTITTTTTTSGSISGGHSYCSGGNIVSCVSDCCVGKTATVMTNKTLVVNQQSSLTPALQLPLYATVNKTNGKTKMTMELSASKQPTPAKVVTVNAIVHEPPSSITTDPQEKIPDAAEHTVRHRKLGAVQGGLQDTVQIELDSFVQKLQNSQNEQETNCDMVMDTLPVVVKDLISFDDDEDANKIFVSNTCDTNSQIVDLLSQPITDLPTVSEEEPTVSVDLLENPPVNKSPPPARSNASSRKTSFDSTCTISSMDSGFIEMQNKLENPQQSSTVQHPSLASIFNGLAAANTSNMPTRDDSRGPGSGGEKIARLNYKECLTQSRNRRKSYEEFKAMFANSNTNLESSTSSSSSSPSPSSCPIDTSIVNEKNKIQIRRKTYQDLRKLNDKDMHCDSIPPQSSTTGNQQTDLITAATAATTIPSNGLASISEQESLSPLALVPTTIAMTLDTDNCVGQTTLVADDSCQSVGGAVGTELDAAGIVGSGNKPAFPNKFAVNTVPGTTNEMDTALQSSTGGVSAVADGVIVVDNDDDKSNTCCLVALNTDDKNSNNNATTTDILRKNSDFLSKILDRQLLTNEKEKAHMRRKSYEEFKRLVRECEMSSDKSADASVSATTPFKRQNSKHRKSYASFLLMRRNSNSKEQNNERLKKSLTANETKNETNKVKLELQQVTGQMPESGTNSGSSNYRHNFKIYDKLVYGTIYDIIQRKNDIYNLTCQRYDKYMTYGTIYEILHRKSSQPSPLASSNSYSGHGSDKIFQRKSLSAILERDCFFSSEKNNKNDLEKIKKSGMIYDIIQKQNNKQQLELKTTIKVAADSIQGKDIDKNHHHLATKTISAPTVDANVVADKENTSNNMTTNVSYKYGTIYDILQGEKLDANSDASTKTTQQMQLQQPSKCVVNNRFVVSKIDEPLKAIEAKTSKEQCTLLEQDGGEKNGNDLKNVLLKATKPNKMRRLSNMLHYKGGDSKSSSTDKSSTNTDHLENHHKDQTKDLIIHSNLIPLDSEELYSRIIAKNRENAGVVPGSPIQKSNSLDAISTSVTISPPASPSPPRPRRSLKQHNCMLRDQQKPKQLQLVKKLSLDNTISAQAKTTATDKEIKLRRWSNQIPLKCNCDFTFSSIDGNDNPIINREMCNSWELSIKMTSNCNCFEALNASKPQFHATIATNNTNSNNNNCNNNNSNHNNCNSSSVIETFSAELSSNNTFFPTPSNTSPSISSPNAQLVRNTCSIHLDTSCLCLASRNNPTITTSTSATTTPTATSNGNSKTTSTKKGKSRRLSEFTRGEFLNEKP